MLEFVQSAPITAVIIAVTCIISYLAFQNRELMDKLIFHPYSVSRDSSEMVRFITNGFIHADFMHLGINMFVLYMFGGFAERTFNQIFDPTLGRIFYLVLYFGAVIVACIPAYMKHKNNSYYRSLGASGGTSAVILSYCIFLPWAYLYIMGILPVPAVVFAIGYLWYSSHMSNKASDNVAHDAHLGGAVFGLFFSLIVIIAFASSIIPQLIEGLLQGPTWPTMLGF